MKIFLTDPQRFFSQKQTHRETRLCRGTCEKFLIGNWEDMSRRQRVANVDDCSRDCADEKTFLSGELPLHREPKRSDVTDQRLRYQAGGRLRTAAASGRAASPQRRRCPPSAAAATAPLLAAAWVDTRITRLFCCCVTNSKRSEALNESFLRQISHIGNKHT